MPNDNLPTWTWGCHGCGTAVPDPRWASSGIPGVHWPMCDRCFGQLSPEDKSAVEDEAKRPKAY